MPTHLCLSIRLSDRIFHGMRDQRVPEWPPSPLRAYQALVAAAAKEGGQALSGGAVQAALMWLEGRPTPPRIIAPKALSRGGNGTRYGYVLSVPNNAMDVVARAWVRGNTSGTGDTDPARHRTMKRVHPTYLLDGEAIYYVWPLPEDLRAEELVHIDRLGKAANSIVALGWGIDMAIGHAGVMSDEQVERLSGELWLPGGEGVDGGLRVPVPGTLKELTGRQDRFLKRVRPNGTFDPTPPLPELAYRRVEYRRATDPPQRAVAAFALLKLDASGFRSFDTVRSVLRVVGMMRYAASSAARRAGWPEAKIAAFVLGHGEQPNAEHVSVGPKRFAYLPLPSIEGRGQGKARVIGSIRRLMLTSFGEGCEEEIGWARRALSGHDLIDAAQGQPTALLSLAPESEAVVRCYVQPADAWATVTPVVLPGYDDPGHYRRRLQRGVSVGEQKRLLGRLNDRIDGLLRNAIVQAGFSRELADHAELEWRKVGLWPGTDLADRYGVPDHLKRFPRFHVRLRWRDMQDRPTNIPGPICLGGGRFYGLGLFAAE